MRAVRPSSSPIENYNKERNETQMENKRPRGRPATGRVRNKQMTFKVTEQEYIKIKEYISNHDTTLAQLVVDKVHNDEK